MNGKLKKGIVHILITNIINLTFSLITNFILPKYLSIDAYAEIKTYQFYINYVGILHLGFIDGLFLKYGGKSYENIDGEKLNEEIAIYRLFQILISLIGVVITAYSHNTTLIIVSLTVFPFNLFTCYKSILQAIGEFGTYSRVINANTIMIFFVNILCLLLVSSDNAVPYILLYTLIYYILWLYLEKENKKHFSKITYKSIICWNPSILLGNIKSGILLMFGNFSSIILTGLDRWFVKLLLNNIAFGQYSFAVSIENFVNFAVTPISTTLYNYFCYEHSTEKIKTIRNSILLFAVALVSFAFPAKFILEIYLTKYIDAVHTIFFLFTARLFFIIIQCLYVNLYKAQRMQKQYFVKLSIVVIAGVVFNIVCFWFWPCKEAFALGTLLCALLWFVLCQFDFKDIILQFKYIFFLICVCICFMLCGYFLNAIVGFIVYWIWLLFVSFLFMKEDLIKTGNFLLSFLIKRCRRA